MKQGKKMSRRKLKPDLDLQGSLREFILPIVEFLGILVPGVVFIFALIPAVIIPIVTVLRIVEGVDANLPFASEYLVNIILSPSMGTMFLLAVFSYVFGHIFFRQDPKIPDLHSFNRVNKDKMGEEKGPVRLCENEQNHNNDQNPKIPNVHNLEFPYRYLYEYLHDRGMDHLEDIVRWKGNNPSTYELRTKHFINVIKVRLEFLFPLQYLRIQRNEAHVRLMSSIWYASNSLISASIIGSTVGVLCVVAYMSISNSTWPIPYIGSVVLPVTVLALATYSKRSIEFFLHYQRIREIVFILEAAYFAKKVYPEFDFYEKSLMTKDED